MPKIRSTLFLTVSNSIISSLARFCWGYFFCSLPATWLCNTQEQLSDQGDKLYEDFFEGKITREVYTKQKDALRERQEEVIHAENTVQERINELSADYSTFVEKYKGLAGLDNLSAEIAADLLDRVTIWPDGRLEIKLNYLDEIALVYGGKL